MLGSIIGDIVGSVYEFDNIRTKDFPLFTRKSNYTDDSILTLATADWLLHGGEIWAKYAHYALRDTCPMGGYGSSFRAWLMRAQNGINPGPYNSCGNGSAMRVGPVGWAFDTLEETLTAAKISSECTHNHPEGIKGAQATVQCIFMARRGSSKEEIRAAIERDFGYDLSMPVSELQKRYSWQGVDGQGNGAICQDSVPQSIICALEAADFEDALRNAISIGGDSDTIGCIAGSIAEAMFGIPETIYQKGFSYLPTSYQQIVKEFEGKYGPKQGIN